MKVRPSVKPMQMSLNEMVICDNPTNKDKVNKREV